MVNFGIETQPHIFRPAAFLEVDTDINSERILIFDRRDAALEHHQRTLGGVIKAVLPVEYAFDANLTCTWLDDSAEFNGAIADSVQCIYVNLQSFNPNNPLPYEPPP